MISQCSDIVLMIRPASFGFNIQTAVNNVFQSESKTFSATEIQQKAVKEFDYFVHMLRQQKIDVLVFQDNPDIRKPDAVFPNNWLATFPNGVVATFPMFASN